MIWLNETNNESNVELTKHSGIQQGIKQQPAQHPHRKSVPAARYVSKPGTALVSVNVVALQLGHVIWTGLGDNPSESGWTVITWAVVGVVLASNVWVPKQRKLIYWTISSFVKYTWLLDMNKSWSWWWIGGWWIHVEKWWWYTWINWLLLLRMLWVGHFGRIIWVGILHNYKFCAKKIKDFWSTSDWRLVFLGVWSCAFWMNICAIKKTMKNITRSNFINYKLSLFFHLLDWRNWVFFFSFFWLIDWIEMIL